MNFLIAVDCPYCGYTIELEKDWFTTADLVYCGNCTMTFEEDRGDNYAEIDISDEEF